jgi:orotate phosphoribosyltransferase
MPSAITPQAAKMRLIEIVRRRSYGTGVEIKLASGRISNFYFNMKPTMLDPQGSYLLALLILDALKDSQCDFVGGLEMGAVPIAAAVTAVSVAEDRPMPAFFVRKKPKDHGTQSLVEGLPRGETLAGKRVIILEDVTTTGGSALKAIESVKADGAIVLGVITAVDRLEGAAEAFAAAGVPFQAILTAADFQ